MNYIHKNENAIYYECGYSCDNAIYLSLGKDSFFFTDSRYEIEANEKVLNSQVIIASNLLDEAISTLKKYHISKITLDSNEWSMKEYLVFKDILPKVDTKERLSQKKRMVKSDDEIKLLKQAVHLGAKGFDKFAKYLSKKGIGKTEKYLSFKNLSYMTNKLELGTSFDAIVAINANSAKPHAHPSELKLQEKDLLLVDAGIKYKRYCSDRTRVCDIHGDIHFKDEQKFKNKNHQKIYDIVRKSHDEAIKQARVGMKASDIDTIARKVIEKSAYGKYFVHSTGHGVGLDIHELPFISSKSSDIIENNMVFTIEPGIYIPNEFGVRFENMVVMSDDRVSIL